MQRLLESRGIRIIETIANNADLKTFIAGPVKPDVYFMDIHLSDGIVFEVLADSKLEIPIIFTTAYDQYAIKAFKQNSIDYLLKPVDETQQVQPTYKDRISVKIGDKIRTIDISDILFFYSSDKINYLYSNVGRAYPIDYSIEEISKQLQPRNFYRVSRGYIVAISAIKDVIAYSNSRLKVIIENVDHEIIVARDRVKEFKQWLG